MRVLHVITSLDTGGAEVSLAKLLSAQQGSEFESLVACMVQPGPVAEQVRRAGVEVRPLGFSRGLASLGGLARLVRLMRSFSPDIVQSWMYHADLLGLAAWKMARTGRLIWNVRASNMELGNYRSLTTWVVRGCARLSGSPAAVVFNSEAGEKFHLAQGYHPRSHRVIGNGFDTERFAPDPKARAEVRKELGLEEGDVVVGLVARVDPMKDHATFCAAASEVACRFPEARFLLCGLGADEDNVELAAMLGEAGIRERTRLLGRRDDAPRIMAALDVLVSSSAYGEGFSNSIGEAMASGAPCVVTDVGDSARIVGDTGRVVAPSDPPALAGALAALVGDAALRRGLGERARRRVKEEFSLEAMARAYAQLYRTIAQPAQ